VASNIQGSPDLTGKQRVCAANILSLLPIAAIIGRRRFVASGDYRTKVSNQALECERRIEYSIAIIEALSRILRCAIAAKVVLWNRDQLLLFSVATQRDFEG